MKTQGEPLPTSLFDVEPRPTHWDRDSCLKPTAPAFARGLERWGNRAALVQEDGTTVSYAELARLADGHQSQWDSKPHLMALEMDQGIESVAAYLACLRDCRPALLLQPDAQISSSVILARYAPSLIWSKGRWQQNESAYAQTLHPQLCLLLSTSGSTGSPKLVRLSQRGVESNAQAIARYLQLDASERAALTLPLHYSFGLSVLHSHLAVGAAVVLTSRSVVEPAFWALFERESATSLSGVPHTFELLEQSGFRKRPSPPSLRYLAQAGGRLPEHLVRTYAAWARQQGRRMFVMYGQTEAGPRIAYVPDDALHEHPQAIGLPIPGGRLHLIDEAGREVTGDDTPGELVYEGPNVMLGYAESPEDLGRGRDIHELRTGDLACRNAKGLYSIVGRKSRMSKLFGQRISWDEVERQLVAQGWPCLVCGTDRALVVALTRADQAELVAAHVSQSLSLPAHAVQVLTLDRWPTLPSGKFDYQQALALARAQASPPSAAETVASDDTVRSLFAEYLKPQDVQPEDSFEALGGDSLVFVELSFELEKLLGVLPEEWPRMTVADLQALVPLPPVASSRQTKARASADATDGRRFWVAMTVAVMLLAGFELALQLRSHFKFGRSVFTVLDQPSATMIHPESGLTTYRPGLRQWASANGTVMDINSWGLRSDELPMHPAPGELRLAVLGASSVAGTYAPTNSDTFPARLQGLLRQRMPQRQVNVINAGVEGFSLDDMAQLASQTLARVKPHAVLIYPGFNDLAYLCKPQQSEVGLQGLPSPDLPPWVLGDDLLAKNTVTLRQQQWRRSTVSRGELTAYRTKLKYLVHQVQAGGMRPVLMTVARAVNGQPRAEQARLAQTALYYNHCLDLDGLIAAGDAFNQEIQQLARSQNLPLVDLAALLPGGEQHFVDASHFNVRGEQRMAELIAQHMQEDPGLLQLLEACRADTAEKSCP